MKTIAVEFAIVTCVALVLMFVLAAVSGQGLNWNVLLMAWLIRVGIIASRSLRTKRKNGAS